jgi:hypothetical protein
MVASDILSDPVRPWSDPLLLPRIEIKATTVAELEAIANALCL